MVAIFVCQLNIKKILLFYFKLYGAGKKRLPLGGLIYLFKFSWFKF